MASGTIKAVASKADVNALNDQIAVVDIGSKTLSGFQTALETLGSSLGNNEFRFIRFYNEVASSPFVASTAYEGKIFKYTTGRYAVELQGAGDALNTITGIYNSGWSWGSLNNKFTWQVFLEASSVSIGDTYASTGKSFVLTKPTLVRVDMSYGTGRPLAIGLKLSETAGSASIALNSVYGSDIADTSGLSVSSILAAGTYYVWARTASSSGRSNIMVAGMVLGA